jgi:hypothetical protein
MRQHSSNNSTGNQLLIEYLRCERSKYSANWIKEGKMNNEQQNQEYHVHEFILKRFRGKTCNTRKITIIFIVTLVERFVIPER